MNSTSMIFYELRETFEANPVKIVEDFGLNVSYIPYTKKRVSAGGLITIDSIESVVKTKDEYCDLVFMKVGIN